MFNGRDSTTILVLDVTMPAPLISQAIKGIDLAAATIKSRSSKQSLEVILMGSEGVIGKNVVYDGTKSQFMEELEKRLAKATKAESTNGIGAKCDFLSASNEIC